MTRASYKGLGVLLRRVDFGEKDQIVTLLLRGVGRRDAVAYGAKVSQKRFAGALDLFRLVEFTYTEGRADALPALSEAHVVEDFNQIERSLEKIAFASYATEFARELLRDGTDADEVLDILLGYYRHTNASAAQLGRLEADLHSLILHLLISSGFGPSLEACYMSGTAVEPGRRWLFSKHGEGALCAELRQPGQETLEVSAESLQLLARLARTYLPASVAPPEPVRLRALRPLMNALALAVIPRELRSSRTLELVLA